MNGRTNEVPEGFKMTEVGLLPEQWHIAKLGDLFEIKQGKALSPEHRRGISPRPFLRTANVFWGYLDLANVDSMDFTDAEVSQLKIVPNDLLVCEGGDIGRTAIWRRESVTYCYQNHLHRLRTTRGDVYPLFYMYWMQAAYLLLKLYEGTGNKTTIPNLSQGRLKSFMLPFPPLPEQKAIAQVLSTIQKAIEAQDKIISAARELKKSLMHHLFTYGPVPVSEAEKVPLKETEIGPVPEHWEVMRLDSVFDSRLGKMLSPEARNGKSLKPYLRNANVQWGKIAINDLYQMNFKEDDFDRYGLVPGDVLVCEGGEVGRTAIWQGEIKECYYQKALHRLRPCGNLMRADFFMYHMMHAFLIRRTYGEVGTVTTIAHLPGVKLKMLPLPVPPITEQTQISKALTSIDLKIGAEEKIKAALQALFKTMLHLLMTGQVRVVGG